MKLKQKLTSAVLALFLLLTVCLPDMKASAATTSAWDTATEGQRNIVRRAYQMCNIRWTPVADMTGWRGKITYKAGTTYTGLPYSQPVNGKYVPYKATLDEFMEAVNDPDSKLYDSYSYGGITMPYYGTDCAAFVSWAWNVSRGPTTSLPGHATVISSYKNAQIGDGLIKVGDHATLITDITYDASGNITSVEVCDSNAYTSGSTQVYWCQRKTYTLSRFLTKFINKGYKVYRVDDYETVPYTHSCAVPLEGDTCRKCGLNYYEETACDFTATVDASATAYDIPAADGVAQQVLFAGSEITVKAYHVDADGTVWYKTADNTWVQADRVTANCAHSYSCQVTGQPSCTAPGTGTYTCSKCLGSYTGAVPALGHSYQSGQCIRCDAVYDPASYVRGDVDLNGQVDSEDSVYLLLHTMFGAAEYPVADGADLDLDRSGATDTDDAVYLLLHVMFGQTDYPL